MKTFHLAADTSRGSITKLFLHTEDDEKVMTEFGGDEFPISTSYFNGWDTEEKIKKVTKDMYTEHQVSDVFSDGDTILAIIDGHMRMWSVVSPHVIYKGIFLPNDELGVDDYLRFGLVKDAVEQSLETEEENENENETPVGFKSLPEIELPTTGGELLLKVDADFDQGYSRGPGYPQLDVALHGVYYLNGDPLDEETVSEYEQEIIDLYLREIRNNASR